MNLKIQHESDNESTHIVDGNNRTVAILPSETDEGMPLEERLSFARWIVSRHEFESSVINQIPPTSKE